MWGWDGERECQGRQEVNESIFDMATAKKQPVVQLRWMKELSLSCHCGKNTSSVCIFKIREKIICEDCPYVHDAT